MKEINFDESLRGVCFANSRGDILVGFQSHISIVPLTTYLPMNFLEKLLSMTFPDDVFEEPLPFDRLLTFSYDPKKTPSLPIDLHQRIVLKEQKTTLRNKVNIFVFVFVFVFVFAFSFAFVFVFVFLFVFVFAFAFVFVFVFAFVFLFVFLFTFVFVLKLQFCPFLSCWYFQLKGKNYKNHIFLAYSQNSIHHACNGQPKRIRTNSQQGI